MEWIQNQSVERMEWIYIAVVVVVTALILGLSWRRSWEDNESILETMGRFDDLGLGAVYQILTLMGIVGMAWVGWRIPADIESFIENGSRAVGAFAMTETWVARLAQVIGALCFTLIALRSMRYVVPVMVGMLIFGIFVWSYLYISAAM